MGSCNEEDFLERLGPQLRWKIRAQRRFCPDAETLSAVLEGTAPGPVCEQVIKHLRHCAQCAALETRLRAFDEVTMPESAVEWTQARARLDNWLDGFLRSERAARAQKEGRSLWGVLTWETVSKFLLPGKLKWALGATVVVLMLIPSALLLRLRHEQLLENQAALRQAIPQQQPASPPAGTPAEAPPRESQKGGQTTVTAPQGKHAATPTSSPESPRLRRRGKPPSLLRPLQRLLSVVVLVGLLLDPQLVSVRGPASPRLYRAAATPHASL
jgi:hypothetical protein